MVTKIKKQSLLSRTEISNLSGIILQQINDISGAQLDSLEKYHELPVEIHECFMAKKSSRVFSRSTVDRICQMDFFRVLRNEFKDYKIANVFTEVYRDSYPEIYFRLVRPGCPQDVGDPHTDFWSHSAYGRNFGGMGSTWKIWIPLVVEKGLNGLNFYPGVTDVSDIQWTFSNGRIFCDRSQEALGKEVLVDTDPGDALVFRDDVLHSGAVNFGNHTRVSIEITFIRDELFTS